jgi:predicted transcriptional regulator
MLINKPLKKTIVMSVKKQNSVQAATLYTTLHQALLLDKKMDKELYEFDLQEHIEKWQQELQNNKDEFMFAITENTGNVAMVLITKRNTVFINGQALKKLKALFKDAYKQNMETLLPSIVVDLLNDNIALNTMRYQTTTKP